MNRGNPSIAPAEMPLQALAGPIGKRLHAIWGEWNYGQDYDPQKFYKMVA